MKCFKFLAIVSIIVSLSACSSNIGLITYSISQATKIPTQSQTSTPGPNRFGVFVKSQDAKTYVDTVGAAHQLGVGWVRINENLGEASPEYINYLAVGINVVLTVRNQDPTNIVTTYGTPKEWGAASFPYKSKAKFSQQIQDLLQPALSYIKSGLKVWVQSGNEIFDASVDPNSLFWRGTMEQYLAQQQALYEAVKSVNPDIPVVLAGFASVTLDELINQNDPGHIFGVKYVTGLLAQGKFDTIDLHFYGCVEDIPTKVKAVKALMPVSHVIPWISTENGGPEVGCKSTPISWSKDLTQFEKLQAQQVPARLSACAKMGGNICLWFSLFDLKSSSDVFNHLGLLDQDETPPRRKPAYEAFKTFITQ